MARVSIARLSSGDMAGALRIKLEVTITDGSELVFARELFADKLDAVRENLKLPARQRGVGPIAKNIADMMLAALDGESPEALRKACQAALRWVENMRIVEGGERARLRDQLRAALGDRPDSEVAPKETE